MATSHGLKEDETCRRFVLPALVRAGWSTDQIRPQYRINEGRLVATSRYHAHSEPLIADYVLEYGPDLPVGVVEAKRTRANAADGIEQAKRYALRLDLPFAYATNGRVIFEIDLVTGRQTEVGRFPSPDELWTRHLTHNEIDTPLGEELLRAPYNLSLPRNWDNSIKRPRYYQRLAVNRTINAIAKGEKRLLTLATGTGKTMVAFQIVAKLRQSGWTQGRKPRVLYLADRNILIDKLPRYRSLQTPCRSGMAQPLLRASDLRVPSMASTRYVAECRQFTVRSHGG